MSNKYVISAKRIYDVEKQPLPKNRQEYEMLCDSDVIPMFSFNRSGVKYFKSLSDATKWYYENKDKILNLRNYDPTTIRVREVIYKPVMWLQ